LSKYLKPESVNFCLTSPPYWYVHRRERSADRKESRQYSDLPTDLGNIPDYNMFLNELKKVF
jgi:DNA modification methylase